MIFQGHSLGHICGQTNYFRCLFPCVITVNRIEPNKASLNSYFSLSFRIFCPNYLSHIVNQFTCTTETKIDYRKIKETKRNNLTDHCREDA